MLCVCVHETKQPIGPRRIRPESKQCPKRTCTKPGPKQESPVRKAYAVGKFSAVVKSANAVLEKTQTRPRGLLGGRTPRKRSHVGRQSKFQKAWRAQAHPAPGTVSTALPTQNGPQLVQSKTFQATLSTTTSCITRTPSTKTWSDAREPQLPLVYPMLQDMVYLVLLRAILCYRRPAHCFVCQRDSAATTTRTPVPFDPRCVSRELSRALKTEPTVVSWASFQDLRPGQAGCCTESQSGGC